MSAVVVPIGSAFEVRVLNSIARAVLEKVRSGFWPKVVLLYPALLPGRDKVFGIPILRSKYVDPRVVIVTV